MDQKNWQLRIDLAIKTNAPKNGVGAFVKGNVLVVGEQASRPEENPMAPEQPFCSDSGCSGWLNKLLSEANIDESRFFWINALLNDGSAVDIRWFADELQPSHVVALGNTAKKSCDAQGIEYIGMYHPQYWKRFRNREKYPLVDLLLLLQK